MRIRAWCDRQDCIGFEMLDADSPAGKCASCGDPIVVRPPDDRSSLKSCWKCGCPNMYVERAFPQILGCAVIAVSALLAIAFARATFGLSFVGIVALDSAMLLLIPTRIVCYQCSAEYYGAPKDPPRKGFDLLIGGKYTTPPGA